MKSTLEGDVCGLTERFLLYMRLYLFQRPRPTLRQAMMRMKAAFSLRSRDGLGI
jgi:hypothetical protein